MKKSDSSNSSRESEASGLGWKALTERRTEEAKEIRRETKGKDWCPRRGKELTARKDELMNSLVANQTVENLLVSGQTKSTDTPAKSIGKGSEVESSRKAISGKSPSQIYLTMTLSAVVFLVKVFPLLEGVKVFKTSQGELFSLKSAESLEVKDQATYSLRMLKDYFLTTQAEPSQLYSFHWMNLGTMSNGRCVTLNISFHKTGKGSLSSVLEEKVDEKFYLSDKTLEKIMEKKDAHPDIRWKSGIRGEGKVQFPDNPNKPSRTITTAESGANRMTHGVDIGNSKIRRLTLVECERLQGFPDGWTEGVSDSQRYKMMGNAVSVPVITAIGKRILKVIK